MFVVFLLVLIVSSIGSGMEIMEHGQMQAGQSTLNLSLQKGNNTWRNISLPDQLWNKTSPPNLLMYDLSLFLQQLKQDQQVLERHVYLWTLLQPEVA